MLRSFAAAGASKHIRLAALSLQLLPLCPQTAPTVPARPSRGTVPPHQGIQSAFDEWIPKLKAGVLVATAIDEPVQQVVWACSGWQLAELSCAPRVGGGCGCVGVRCRVHTAGCTL